MVKITYKEKDKDTQATIMVLESFTIDYELNQVEDSDEELPLVETVSGSWRGYSAENLQNFIREQQG